MPLATSSSRKLRPQTVILRMPNDGFDAGRKLQQVNLLSPLVWLGAS